MSSRHLQREKAMTCVYQYLLVARDIDTLIEDTYQKSVDKVDPYFIEMIRNSITHLDEYHSYIDEVIKEGWSFDRLGKVEQAILLNGCSEFALKQIDAAVIIDESVELAKKFCEDDAYKLINSVLDVI